MAPTDSATAPSANLAQGFGDDPLIEPVSAPLSTSGAQTTGDAQRQSRRWLRLRAPLAGGLLALLLVVAAFVLLLPQRVVESTRAALPSAFLPQAGQQTQPSPATGTRAKASRSDEPPPFAAMSLAQERKAAQDELTGFLDLQVLLEDERNARVWGGPELDAAKDRALAGDALFRDEDYAAAGREYAAAVAALRGLLADANRRFDTALKNGAAALAALDEEGAVEAFERAARLRPDDARVTQGKARAARVPEIATLVLDADRAALRGDHDQAQELLEKARAVDAATPGLDARFRSIAAARSEAWRKRVLSAAFAALERGDHEAAQREFNRVLAAHPADAAAQAGLQETEQLRIVARIDALRTAALAQAEAEDWPAALASYNEALAIDSSLRFAREGRASLRTRMALARAMDRVIDDPPLLSSNEEFAAAHDLLARARATAEAESSAQLSARVEELQSVLEWAATPVPLVLTSDGATDIVIHKVRAMGVFARVELTLRPGRYVIVGSRDGCRDVRKEITLAADMGPVDIRCTERI